MDPEPAAIEHDEPPERVLLRIRIFSVFGYVAFAVFVVLQSGWKSLIGLTCGAAVVMINFLWLEEIVSNLLQPTPHLRTWRLTLRALARFALLGVAVMVTIYVARLNALSVLLGFSIVVVGIMVEALYSLYRSVAG
jgi:hypothetical protein